jgi:hypothetical protein
MAEEIKNNDVSVENNTENQSAPTVDELMAQIEQLTADRDKFKNANDKLSKSEAEMKRQLRAKQTEEEQLASGKAEEERLRTEELEHLRKELNHNKAVNAYKTVSDNKMVENLIEAVSNADHNVIANILEQYASTKVREAQADWQKSRPRVNIGGEGGLTKEQFNAMSMAEKSKLYRENKAEYERLNS